MLMMPMVRAEIIGEDALGRGQEPALCWWLPDGASVQHAYRVRTDDGFDTGRVDGPVQLFVRLPVFDRSRRSAAARVKVWTDLGESEWSEPVRLESGLLEEVDWSARWIGVAEAERAAAGGRPAGSVAGSLSLRPRRKGPRFITASWCGQREAPGRRRAGVADGSFDDRAWDSAGVRDVEVAIVRPVAPPVRRIEEIRPVAVRPVRGGSAVVVDFGQNFSGWVRLACPGPAVSPITLSHGEWLGRAGDPTTAHLDVDLPVVPEPLPLGQVDQVVPGSGGEVFEPRLPTHRFRYVRAEGHPRPLDTRDVTGVVVHSGLRR